MLIPLAIPLAVCALALLVLLADMVMPTGERRGLGALTTIGLIAILGTTWAAPEGAAFNGAFVQDAFALYIQRVLLAAAALGCLGSIEHADRMMPKRQGEYFLLLLMSLSGMLLLAGARELILLVVCFELMGIPLYVLAAMHKTSPHGVEGALKLFLTGAVSTVIMLYGLSFVVGTAGTTTIAELSSATPSPMFVLGMMLTLAGMGFKIGAVPFHMWVPDTYQGAPTPFVAFLSVAPKVAGFAALARLFLDGFSDFRSTWWPVLLAFCIATMVLGNLWALAQSNIKRLLGYSGIAHIGLLLLAFGIETPEGLGMLLFYLAAYLFTNMGAFFVVEVVGRQGSDEIDAYRGLSRRSPALALAMLLFLLSLGGIPFVAGFWAKILLLWAAWKAGMGLMVVLAACLAVLALFYYLKVARSIYIEPPADDATGGLHIDRPTAFAIAIAMGGVVGMGIMPGPIIESAMTAARSMLGG